MGDFQRRRVLILVDSCVHILYGITAIVLSSMAVSLISEESHVDNKIEHNWKQDMIMDVISPKEDSCPQGYEQMFFYEWPGNKDACNCQIWNEEPSPPQVPDGEMLMNKKRNFLYKQIVEFKKKNKVEEVYSNEETKEDILARLKKFGLQNKIYEGELCNWNQTQAGCFDIKENKATYLSRWKQKHLLCIQRAQQINMYNVFKYYDPKKQACKDDSFRVCGDPSDPNYQYCIPASLNLCPINSFKITSVPPQKEEKTYFNSQPIQISKKQNLYFSRNLPKQLPVSNIIVSEDVPCTDGISNISQGHNDYKLLKTIRQRCPKDQLDVRYELIDQQGEQSFFYNNNKLYLKQRLPFFKFDNQYIYGLYQRRYVEWKHSCSDLISFFFSNTEFDSFQSKESTLKLMTYLIGIITILVAITQMLLICNTPFIVQIEKPLVKWSPAVQIVLQGILLPFIIAALYQAITVVNFEDNVFSKHCSDNFTLKTINSGGAEIHHEVVGYNKGQLIFVCLILLGNVVILIINLFCNPSNPPKKSRNR